MSSALNYVVCIKYTVHISGMHIITWPCLYNVTHKLFVLCFYQHPFIADVVDNKPLKELYNEAKADVIEEFEDLPEDTEVPFVCACFSSN